MSNKTAEGLRDRLFDALDGLIDGTIKKESIESICYVSEQIIKSAQVELEFQREQTKRIDMENQYRLQLKREEKESIKLLNSTIESIGEIDVKQQD